MSRFIFTISTIIFLFSCTLNAQQNFWEQANGPAGRWSGGTYPAMNSSGHIFCTSDDGCVYRSIDHGLTWKQLRNGLDGSIAGGPVAINRLDHIFIGGWNFAGGWDRGGVFRSTDNGESWTKTNFPYGFPVKMAIDSLGNLLVATFHDCAGVIKSTDEGQTWERIGPVYGEEMTSLIVNSAGHIFAGTDETGAGVYRSTDNGLSWWLTALHFRTQNFAFNSQGHIYTVRGYCYGAPSLYISKDNGASCDPINTLTPAPDGATYEYIAIDSKDNIFITSSTAYSSEYFGRVYRSNDNGASWSQIGNWDCGGILINKLGHLLVWGHSYGILYSSDSGEHWQRTGPITSCVNTMAFTTQGFLLVGLDVGVCYTSDGGNNWLDIGLQTQNIYCIEALNIDLILAGTNDGIYLTKDLGENWTPNGLPNTSVMCLECITNGDIFAGTASSGLYRSTNHGISWAYVGLMNRKIRSFWANNLNTFCIGIENEGIYRSVDDGISWSFVGLPNTTVTLLTSIDDNIFAGTNSGIYKSSDGGTSWEFIGLNDHSIQDILSTPTDGIYAATSDDGVYRSLNQGQTWTPLNSGLNHLNVKALAIDRLGYLFAGTDGGGVHKSKEDIFTVIEDNKIGLSNFELLQNYPNPFNPSTTIEFALPKSAFVTLKVYNLLGEEVATLIAEQRAAGIHRINWDARGLASGVYLYRLEAGDFVQTKKLILLR